MAEHSKSAAHIINEVPEILAPRMLSVRAFDSEDMMIDADIFDGKDAHIAILTMLNMQNCKYLQIHFAKRGCFAANVFPLKQ